MADQFEPVSDYVKTIFSNYREIKARVYSRLRETSAKRAQLANRSRRGKKVQVGDEVVFRDPRQRKAGGRTPYKQPLTEPALVTKILSDNRVQLKTQEDTIIENVHLEDCLLVPTTARNLEKIKSPLELEPDESIDVLDTVHERRSPGEMLEDQGRRVQAHAKALAEDQKKLSRGVTDKLVPGGCIVYTVADKTKVVTVGKIVSMSKTEKTLLVHRYKPISDGRLRIYWKPIYIEGGVEVLGEGAHALTEFPSSFLYSRPDRAPSSRVQTRTRMAPRPINLGRHILPFLTIAINES